ncbi:MAG: hypothetical protein WD771_01640 [Gemmatimonadaceae bacterium]
MDLFPLRVAAAGGSIDGIAVTKLVAAGFTLLQRSVPLVRALAGRRSALLLPASPQLLVALAASDGRGAVIIEPPASGAPPGEITALLERARVGAVFTMKAYDLAQFPVRVLLDDAPVSATVATADGARTRVDLGSHFGLDLVGDATALGRDEECVVVYAPGAERPRIITHRELLDGVSPTSAGPHAEVAAVPNPSGLIATFLAPLLAGANVQTRHAPSFR